MRKLSPRIMARARPGALPVPVRTDVTAFAPPAAYDRWDAGVRAVASGDNVITIFDVIGEDYWSGGGVTAKSVTAQLRAIGHRPITVQINSPGGDMFEGIAIYELLRVHEQPITIQIAGIAASAASIIAMAGDTVEIGAASFMMIHNCNTIALGNRHDFTKQAAEMLRFDTAMAGVYAARSGQTAADCATWMDAETFMQGAQAVERGFADSLLAADQVTTDPAATTSAKQVNDVRAMELALVAAGSTRTEARARINSIKGTPGAAPADGTPGAAEPADWMTGATALLAALKS